MSLPRRTAIALAAAALLAGLAGCHRASDVTTADLGAGRAHRAEKAPDSTARAGAAAGVSAPTSAAKPSTQTAAALPHSTNMPARPAAASIPPTAKAPDTRTAAASVPSRSGPSPADSTRVMGAPSATLDAAIASAAPDVVDDASITRKVAAAIAADKDLRPLKIDVDTQNGIVTLSGPAPTASAKAHADEVARTVGGVVSVNNQLTLQAG